MPPQWVCGPQVGAQVAPHVWTPPQWVSGPQVMTQVTPQVWIPPQTEGPPQVMMGWQETWTVTGAAAGGQPPHVWMPPQTEGPPAVAAPPPPLQDKSWVRGPCINWVNGFTVHPL